MLDQSPLVSAPGRQLHPTSHEQNKRVSKCVNVCVCPGLNEKYCSGAVSEWRCVFVWEKVLVKGVFSLWYLSVCVCVCVCLTPRQRVTYTLAHISLLFSFHSPHFLFFHKQQGFLPRNLSACERSCKMLRITITFWWTDTVSLSFFLTLREAYSDLTRTKSEN